MNAAKIIRGLAGALLLAGFVVVAACNGDGDTDDRVQDTARDAGEEIRQEARDAWAELRTDAERLIDDVQARNDPEVKQQLLDRCRDLEERLRNADANADRVNEFCNSVRDADVSDSDAWQEIQTTFKELDDRFRS